MTLTVIAIIIIALTIIALFGLALVCACPPVAVFFAAVGILIGIVIRTLF